MAKPNYSFEKRQKELARKHKQEEKRQRKLKPSGEELQGEHETAAVSDVDVTKTDSP